MKTNVQQIILFVQAAEKLREFVSTEIDAVPISERNGAMWQGLMEAERASGVIKFMADQLCSAEVSVKG